MNDLKNKLIAVPSGDNWMVRFSDNGTAYGGFQWNPVGEWTTAPDWDPTPECGNGLHGQGPGGWGYCQSGGRFELVQTKGKRVSIEGNKVKVKMGKIIAVDNEAWKMVISMTTGKFGGSINLRGYAHP